MLVNQSLTIPSGELNGSRQIIKLQLNTSRDSWNNLVIRWQATSPINPERNIDNNIFDLTLWVNTPPVIEDVYCDSTQFSRGDRFVCSIESSDDVSVDSVQIAWRVSSGNNSTEWVWQNTGSQDGFLWWTTIDLPADIPLGVLDLRAKVMDESNLTTNTTSLAIAQIRNAPAFWFGIHVSGVDDSEWGGASVLTSSPFIGVRRGYVTTLKACVLDPDHNSLADLPIFISSRGNIDGLTHVQGSSSDHHCYIASLTIPTLTTLDPFDLELRTSNGDFLTSRTVKIKDQAPVINMSIVDESGNQVENVLASGNEQLKILVTDFDDEVSNIYGDVIVKWPGQNPYTIPVVFENGLSMIPLITTDIIESGNLQVNISVTGANGATSTSYLETTIVLSPPAILSIDLCQNGSIVEQLMFGQSADAVVRTYSSRPVSSVVATLKQLNWDVTAPSQAPTNCGTDVPGQNGVYHFRIRLDASFIPGEGSLGVRIVDIDEIASNSYLQFEFLHSPPTIEVSHDTNVSHGSQFEVLVEMEDADGIDATCGINYFQNGTEVYSRTDSEVADLDGSGFWASSWILPNGLSGNLTINISCKDWSDNIVNYSSSFYVSPPLECTEDCDEADDKAEDSSQSITTPLTVTGIILILIIIVFSLKMRTSEEKEEVETWNKDESSPKSDDRIPEGWTLEEFLDWLDGPMPEDWEENKWQQYRESLEDLRLA